MTVPHAVSDSEDSGNLIDIHREPSQVASPHSQPTMSGFSFASISSFCTSISHRIHSSIDIVDGVVERTSHEGLASLLGMLHSLNGAVLQLEASLAGANAPSSPRVLSPRLQTDINRSLSTCDTAIAAVEKQLMQRFEPHNAAPVADKGFLAPLYDFMASHIQLFTYLQKVLLK
jgi:hypothetical protein